MKQKKAAVVKTQQDVFIDAQRINDVFQLIYSDTYLMNLYYDNMDKYLVGFDETYYDLNSSIVYIDKGTAYITLRASNMGDYQCDYVNMEIDTIDNITLKVK